MVSRGIAACFTPKKSHPITVIPIDQVHSNVQNKFEILKKKEMFWIYRLRTLQPNGLNEMTELIKDQIEQESQISSSNSSSSSLDKIKYTERICPLEAADIGT